MDSQAKSTLDQRLAAGQISVEEYKNLISIIQVAPSTNNRQDQLIVEVNNEFSVYKDYCIFKGKEYRYDCVEVIVWSRDKQSINLISVGDSTVFGIIFSDGEKVNYVTDTMLFRGLLSIRLEKAYSYINQLTASTRVNALEKSLREKGSLRIPAGGNIVLGWDGFITDKDSGVSLSIMEATRTKNFYIGNNFPGRRQPDEIAIFGEKESLFNRKKLYLLLGVTSILGNYYFKEYHRAVLMCN